MEQELLLDKSNQPASQYILSDVIQYGTVTSWIWLALTHFAILATLACVWTWIMSSRYLGGFGKDPVHQFHWHPFFNATAFLVLCEGVMAYRMFPGSHSQQKWFHGICNTAATAMLAIGAYFAIHYHERVGIRHFYSVHAWVGLATMTTLLVQWLIGLVSFALPVLGRRERLSVVPVHKWLGVTTFMLILANLMLGLLNYQPGLTSPSKTFANALALLFIFCGASIMFWLGPPSAQGTYKENRRSLSLGGQFEDERAAIPVSDPATGLRL